MRILILMSVMAAGWGGQVAGQRPTKCGLSDPSRRDMITAFKATFAPMRQVTFISPDGHFAVHYDTTGVHSPDLATTPPDSTPDWVVEVAAALEVSRSLLLTLGFDPVPADGDSIYDAYLTDYNGRTYGETTAIQDIGGGRFTSFLAMDNDFAEDENYFTHHLDAVRITAAHEYFHAVQMGYKPIQSDIFLYELSSTWFENVAFPEVNDWMSWYPEFGNNPTRSITTSPLQGGGYSIAIFGHYLTWWFGGTDIIRQVWNAFKSVNAIDALENGLAVKGSNLTVAWTNFVARLFFNGQAPEFYFHPDQALLSLPRTGPAATLIDDATFVFDYLRPGKAGIQAFKLLGPSNLQLEVLAPPPVPTAELVVARNLENYSLKAVLGGPWIETDLNSLSTVVLVVGAESGSMEVATTVKDTLDLLVSALDYLAPNPLVLSRKGQSGLTLKYTVAKSLMQGDHRLVIYNLLGEEIYRRQWFQTVGAGSKTFEISRDIMHSWPTGVYFMTFMIDGRYRFNRSFTILK